MYEYLEQVSIVARVSALPTLQVSTKGMVTISFAKVMVDRKMA